MCKVQRCEVLRMVHSYCAVSERAGMVSAVVIPIDLISKEHKAIYMRKVEDSREVLAREERQRTLNKCQLSCKMS